MPSGFNVDVDLFVKSASQGWQDGVKGGSEFSNFVNSMVKGFDDQLKYEEQQQQNVIRANQIEMLPVENRIRTAVADKADAELALFRNNPEEYLARQQQAADTEHLANQQKEQLLIQEQQFQEVMESGDPKAQANAYFSGNFDLLFGYKPQLKENLVEKTYRAWEPEDKEAWRQVQAKGRQSSILEESTQAVLESGAKAYIKTQVEGSGIKNLMMKSGVSAEEFWTKGRIDTIEVPETFKRPSITKKNPDGTPVMEDVPDTTKPARSVQALFIGDKPVLGANGKPIAVTEGDQSQFTDAQYYYKYKNKLLPGMNGQADREAEAKAYEAEQEKKNAPANAVANMTPAERQAAEERFHKVTPAYQTPARQVASEMQANQAERAPQPKENSVIVPRMSDERMFNRTMDMLDQRQARATSPAPSPAAAQGPAQSGSRTVKFQGVETEEPGWVSNIRERQDAQAAKAAAALQRRKPSPEGGQPQRPLPSPQVQAKIAATPTAIPEAFEVLTTNKAPDEAKVNRVASRPELQNMSALVKAVVAVESGGDPNAQSPIVRTKDGRILGGVKGIAQVTKATADEIAPGLDRTTPENSAFLGAVRLQSLINRFENPMIALVGYNAGPEVARRAVEIAGTTDWVEVRKAIPQAVREFYPEEKVKETLAYADRVISYFPRFVQTSSDMVIANSLRNQGVIRF